MFLVAQTLNSRPPMIPVLPARLLFLAFAATLFASAGIASAASERQLLAKSLLTNSRISLLNYHVSGRRDNATALDNMLQTANGTPVRRSYYGRAPGGTTQLDTRMLRALRTLAREGYSFRITELAGGSHSSTSRHYSGVAFDIDMLNGRKVRAGHPLYRRFIARCRELGANEIFGPGTRGHSSHVHIAWARPKSKSKSK